MIHAVLSSRARLPALLACAALFAASLVSMGGCEAVYDGVAAVTGAPTSKDFAAEREKIEAAEAARAQADEARDALAEQVDAEQRRQAEIASQREALEAQYAAMAGQLVTLAGEARKAMVEAMDAVRRRMDAAGDLERQQAEVVANYQRAIAQATADLDDASAAIEQAEATFEALIAQKDDALSGLSGAINTLAGFAVQFGAPAPIVEGVRDAATFGLGSVATGAPVAALAWWQRRKAANRGKIIKATERYNLLATADPEAKKAAKSELPPGAVAELQRLTAGVSKVSTVKPDVIVATSTPAAPGSARPAGASGG